MNIGATSRASLALTAAASITGANSTPPDQPFTLPTTTSLMLPASLALSALQDNPAPTDTVPSTPTAGGGTSDLAKKLQNPVADLVSLPLQFNYDDGFGPDDAARYTLNIQPVIPITLNDDWNLISRTIIPLIYQEELADGLDSDAGIGDILQSFFLSPKEPVGGWILGAGPVALIPTGTDPQLRSEQFALGPTVVALRQEHGWTYGALVNHLWSLSDPEEDRERINATFLQPFVSYTFPSATSITLNAESTYDWSDNEWTIPVNLMLGQVMRLGNQPVSLQLGGRYYAEAPDGAPEWGLRFTITFLFPK